MSCRRCLFRWLILLSLLPAGMVMALETGPLEREVGFTEGVMGARVESVEDVAGTDDQKILVSIPAEGGQAPEIEEVLVTAPSVEQGAELETTGEKPRYEFIDDYANDRYGFVIYLGKQKKFPFRINFKDTERASGTGDF